MGKGVLKGVCGTGIETPEKRTDSLKEQFEIMKIIFMGTPDFAVGALEALLKAGHEVTAVVTQPDKQKGRDRKVQFSPVKECALAHGLTVLQPARIKTREAVEELKKYEADIFVVAAFGQILSKEILEMPRYGCINIHASLLPKYRGASPIQYAILNGDDVTGVTIMQMNEGMDTGDILTMKAIPVEKDDTGGSLFEKLSALGAELLIKTLPKIEAGEIIPVKQQEDATHVRMLTKNMGRIDWKKDADVLERLVRGMNPWPSAYCSFRGKSLKVWRAEISREEQKEEIVRTGFFRHSEEKETIPGEVLLVKKDSIYVQTGRDVLVLKEVQFEGKKRMPVQDFLLGCQVKAGEFFES